MEKNNHLEDQFRKILEDHPEFEVPQTDLDDMRHRLDAADASKRDRKGGFFAWFFPLLLLPVSLGLTYLFYQNHQLTTEVQSLQDQLLITKQDTIQQQHITYIYDTVYNTIHKETIIQHRVYPKKENRSRPSFTSVVNRFSNSRATPLFSTNQLNAYAFDQRYYNTHSSRALPYHYLSSNDADRISNPSNDFAETNKQPVDQIETNNKHYHTLNLASKFRFLEDPINWSNRIPLNELEVLYQKKRANPMYHLRPKGFQLGLSINPLGIADLSGSNAGRLVTYGIVSEIAYSKKFRLGIGFQSTRYQGEVSDPGTVPDFPASAPDNPGDVLRELYVSLQQIQIPITFKYLFYNNKKFTPFISAGFAASRSTKQSFRSEFITNTFMEYSKTQNFSEGTFSIKNFRGAVGLEYDINANWAASAATYYYHDFQLDLGEYFTLKNIGLNLSLKKKW